jgi:hypothetical protein
MWFYYIFHINISLVYINCAKEFHGDIFIQVYNALLFYPPPIFK